MVIPTYSATHVLMFLNKSCMVVLSVVIIKVEWVIEMRVREQVG